VLLLDSSYWTSALTVDEKSNRSGERSGLIVDDS
jgi:hypothetical protein